MIMNNIELKFTGDIQILPSGKMGIYSITYTCHYDEVDDDYRIVNSYSTPELMFASSSDMMLIVNDMTKPVELRQFIHDWILSNPSDENYINKVSLLGFNQE